MGAAGYSGRSSRTKVPRPWWMLTKLMVGSGYRDSCVRRRHRHRVAVPSEVDRAVAAVWASDPQWQDRAADGDIQQASVRAVPPRDRRNTVDIRNATDLDRGSAGLKLFDQLAEQYHLCELLEVRIARGRLHPLPCQRSGPT